MDPDIPAYEEQIAEESRLYSINLDSEELAHFIMLHEKYATKDEKKYLNIDIMYETIIGGDYNYTEKEKDTIKKQALVILNTKYNKKSKIRYCILKSLIKDNHYSYKTFSNLIGYPDDYVKQIIDNKRTLTYEIAVKISSVFHMTPDDIFYTEYKSKEK